MTIGRHGFTPALFSRDICYHCGRGFEDQVHADTVYAKSPRIDVPATEKLEQRLAAMEQEKKEILAEQKRRNHDRVERARRIASILWNKTQEPVMVWQIQDYWADKFEHLITWRDESGKTYWAGAIFTKKEWRCVGMGRSPRNHNDSNKKWVPIETP